MARFKAILSELKEVPVTYEVELGDCGLGPGGAVVVPAGADLVRLAMLARLDPRH